MQCPKCGSKKVFVMNTMPFDNSKLYRKRGCKDCGARFSTVETLDDGSSAFKYEYAEALKRRSVPYGERKARREQKKNV